MKDTANDDIIVKGVNSVLGSVTDVLENELRGLIQSTDRQLRTLSDLKYQSSETSRGTHLSTGALVSFHDSAAKVLGSRPAQQGSVERKLDEIKQALMKK